MPESLSSTQEPGEDAYVAVYQGDRAGEMYKLTRGREIVVGRDESCQIMLADEACSRKHGAFVWRDSAWWLDDLGSRNGTLVNGQRMARTRMLEEGDLIRVGNTKLRFTRELAEVSRSRSETTGGCASAVSCRGRRKQ